jgi:hypothetical protein
MKLLRNCQPKVQQRSWLLTRGSWGWNGVGVKVDSEKMSLRYITKLLFREIPHRHNQECLIRELDPISTNPAYCLVDLYLRRKTFHRAELYLEPKPNQAREQFSQPRILTTKVEVFRFPETRFFFITSDA